MHKITNIYGELTGYATFYTLYKELVLLQNSILIEYFFFIFSVRMLL